MTHICVMSSHKPIRIYMGGLILGVNTLYSYVKLFPMVSKGLKGHSNNVCDNLRESVNSVGVVKSTCTLQDFILNATSSRSRLITHNIQRNIQTLTYCTSRVHLALLVLSQVVSGDA